MVHSFYNGGQGIANNHVMAGPVRAVEMKTLRQYQWKDYEMRH